jgi:hypothetical protein
MDHASSTRRLCPTALPVMLLGSLSLAGLMHVLPGAARADDNAAAAEKRLADTVRYLASDELEGRGPDTNGINLAADYIARQFADAGLKTDLFEGKPFQKFSITTVTEIGPDNQLALSGPSDKAGGQPVPIKLTQGKDYTALAVSGSATFDLPLVFVGYGITAATADYDEYQGINAAGKAVIILRHQPHDPNRILARPPLLYHDWLTRKVANAREHGAAAVVFCSDLGEVHSRLDYSWQHWRDALDRLAAENDKLKDLREPTLVEIETERTRIVGLMREVEAWSKQMEEQHDPILPMRQGCGPVIGDKFPVLFCCRGPLDRMLKASLGKDLATLEAEIDRGPTPHSAELTGWRLVGRVDVRSRPVELKNVVAVLEPKNPAAKETIVVGAHYDHLGHRTQRDAILPGADDNASGTALVLEVARSLARRAERLPRRIVFIAFTVEEPGCLGSGYYVQHPLVPLEQTITMVNADMEGQLHNNHLNVYGSDSCKQFAPLLNRLAQGNGLELNFVPHTEARGDTFYFYPKGVPVIYFNTGLSAHYHWHTDKLETLNIAGIARIARFTERVIVELATAPKRPEYFKVD